MAVDWNDEHRGELVELLKRDALRVGQFTLASGRSSHYYIDGRKVTLGAEGARLVLRDRYPFEQVVEIGTMDDATVLAWVGQASDEASRAYLEEAARLMREAMFTPSAWSQALLFPPFRRRSLFGLCATLERIGRRI